MSYKHLHQKGKHSLIRVAAECEVSERTVQNWHKGAFEPKLKYMPILKRMYGLSYNQMVPLLLTPHDHEFVSNRPTTKRPN